jgi:hypothetical protein
MYLFTVRAFPWLQGLNFPVRVFSDRPFISHCELHSTPRHDSSGVPVLNFQRLVGLTPKSLNNGRPVFRRLAFPIGQGITMKSSREWPIDLSVASLALRVHFLQSEGAPTNANDRLFEV